MLRTCRGLASGQASGAAVAPRRSFGRSAARACTAGATHTEKAAQLRRQHPWTAIGSSSSSSSSSSGSESESEEQRVAAAAVVDSACVDDGAGMWAVPLHLDDGEGERPANPAPTPSSDGAPLAAAAARPAAPLHPPVVLHAHMYPQHHHASADSSPEYGEPGDTGVYVPGSEDDAVVQGAWAAATGAGGAAARKRVRGSVKPHSGLEAQEAADYEARLIAGEEREARTAADRSGQSSDDEDGGGSGELAAAIDQQRKRSASAASASKKAHRGGGTISGDVVPLRGPAPLAALPSGASEFPDASHMGDSGDADQVEALRLAAALAAQQEADNRSCGALDSSEEDELRAAAAAVALKTPNRFLDVPLEPLEPDSLALAAALLHDRDAAGGSDGSDTDTHSIARSAQPTGSVDEVVGHLLHDLEPTLPLSAGGGGAEAGAGAQPDVTARPPLAHSRVVGQEGVAHPPDMDPLGVCSGGPEDEELCSALGLTPSARGDGSSSGGGAQNAARSAERRAAEAGL